MSQIIKAGLVGVTGYTGMELARLMTHHSSMDLVRVTSRKEAGKKLAEIYPFLNRLPLGELVITQPDPADLADECDVVFLAVPHKTAMEIASELLDQGVKVVDLSADFRINDKGVYEQVVRRGAHPRRAAGRGGLRPARTVPRPDHGRAAHRQPGLLPDLGHPGPGPGAGRTGWCKPMAS